MTARPTMPDLRRRLNALSVDRAPLRRAGLLAVLLVALLAAGTAFGPDRAAGLAPPADRQELLADPESVSAPPSAPGWTGGRVIALLLLVAGGGIAVVLHRRAPSAGSRSAMIDVLETHPLGPGQTLQLVACGEEVLLLSVGGEQTQLLRHWPRTALDADALCFADALAQAATDEAADGDAAPATGEPLVDDTSTDDDVADDDVADDDPGPEPLAEDPVEAAWLAEMLAAVSLPDEDGLDDGSPPEAPSLSVGREPLEPSLDSYGRETGGDGGMAPASWTNASPAPHPHGDGYVADGVDLDGLGAVARFFSALDPPAPAASVEVPAPERPAGLRQFGGA